MDSRGTKPLRCRFSCAASSGALKLYLVTVYAVRIGRDQSNFICALYVLALLIKGRTAKGENKKKPES